MIEINLESMKDVQTKEIDNKRCLIILTSSTGAKIEIVTTKENGSAIYDSIEKVCINKAYWYESMEQENEILQKENDDLKDILHYREAM